MNNKPQTVSIVIVGGQMQADVETYFNTLDKGHDSITIKFPERTPNHPQKILEETISVVTECIQKKISIYILTYSELVLLAVRIAIKEYNVTNQSNINGECHQILNNGSATISSICSNGRLIHYENGIFNIEEKALLRLI